MTFPNPAAFDTGRGVLPERTYERLLDGIIRGRLAPGQRVVESDIAIQLGVSRTPIREALAQLTREGFLVAATLGRRTELAVAPLDAARVSELWGIVGALEGQAAKLAAALPLEERARLAAELRSLNTALMQTARARPRDPDGLLQGQARFHDRYVRPYAGAALLALYDAVRPHVQRYEWAFGLHYEAELRESTDEHERIIQAIGSGDLREAREAVEDHWTKAAIRTAQVIERITPQTGFAAKRETRQRRSSPSDR